MLSTYKANKYFTEFTWTKAILYGIATAYVLAASVVVTLQPFLAIPCQHIPDGSEPKTANVMYVYNPCRFNRYSTLLWLTVEECEFGRRLVWAVILGCLIGWERRNADRPAGIRTMALVSLGSCLFSITSAFAFLSGPMSWDSSRVAAAIPSGVGFLGSALIFKHKEKDSHVHEVHGLTTAASVWLSAAVGIACAGGMYFVASLSTAIMLVLLRFGPRTNIPDPIFDEDEEAVEENHEVDESRLAQEALAKYRAAAAASKTSYNSVLDAGTKNESQRLVPPPSLSASQRTMSVRRNMQASVRPSLM